MSKNNYNSFFAKIQIESYESENSEDSTENFDHISIKITKFLNLFKKLLKNRIGQFLRNLFKLTNYRSYKYYNYYETNQLESSENQFNNNMFRTDDEDKIYFPNDDESFLSRSIYKNDLINEQEQIRILKFEIMRSKLLQVFNIFYKYMCVNFLHFCEKIRIKLEMQNFFNKDDNFLYFLPKPKLFRFRSIYAFRRLIFFIKTFKFRKNLFMKNFFCKWRDLSKPKFYSLSKKEKSIWNVTKSVISLENLLNSRYFSKFFAKIFFIREAEEIKSKIQLNNKKKGYIAANSDIQIISKDSTSYDFLSQIIVGIESLDNISFMNVKASFKHFITNMGNYTNRFNPVEYLKHQQSIIKVFYNHYFSKTFTHRKTAKMFYHWKKIAFALSFIDDSNDTKRTKKKQKKNIKIGFKLIDNFFNEKLRVIEIFPKQKFIEKLKFIQKIKNTLKDYGTQYKKIPFMISDYDSKKNLLSLRNTFLKIMLMKKVFLIVDKKKYANLEENYGSVLYDTNKIQQNEKMLLFYKWKKLAIDFYRNNYIHKQIFAKFLMNLGRKIKSHKMEFFKKIEFNRRFLKNQKILSIKDKLLCVKNIFLLFSNNLIRNQKHFLTNFKNKLNHVKTLKMFKIKSIILNASKNYNISRKRLMIAFNIWMNIFRKVNGRFVISCAEKTNVLESQKMRKLQLLQIITTNNYEKNLRNFFKIFKIQSRDPNQRLFMKSKPLSKIDHLIVQNQTKVISDLEKDDIRLTNELTKLKFSFTDGRILKYFYSLDIKFKKRNFHKYFKKWKEKINPCDSNRNLNCNKFSFLKNEIETVKSERENLNQKLDEVRINYKNTIDDYEYLKSQFCDGCVGENLVIDYKSVKDLNMNSNNTNNIQSAYNTMPNAETENENMKNNPLNTSKIVESFMSESKISNFISLTHCLQYIP